MKQHKVFKRHTSALKPSLAVTNKHDGLLHALEKIDIRNHPMNTRQQQQDSMKFVNMRNETHGDEKWYPPEQHVKHKSHITKVMFLCAMARPCRLHNRWWNGKIGIWPVGFCRAAVHDSVNRPAGTQLFEPESIDMDECRCMSIGNVLPAIPTEFPACEMNRHKHIIV